MAFDAPPLGALTGHSFVCNTTLLSSPAYATRQFECECAGERRRSTLRCETRWQVGAGNGHPLSTRDEAATGAEPCAGYEWSGVSRLGGSGGAGTTFCPSPESRPEICASSAQPTGDGRDASIRPAEADACVRLGCRSRDCELSLGFFQDSNKFRGGMGQASAPPRHQINVARKV